MDARESFDTVLRSLTSWYAKEGVMGPSYDAHYKTLQFNVRAHAPEFLYKYFNSDNADKSIEDLRNGRLYMASPDRFDDEYDVRPQYDASEYEQYLRDDVTPERMEATHQYLRRFNPVRQEMIRRGIKELEIQSGGFVGLKERFIDESLNGAPYTIERFRGAMRCSCLAEEYDSMLMWGLYASKHGGFVAQYESPKIAPPCWCERRAGDGKCQYETLPISITPVIYKGRNDVTLFMDVFGGSTSLFPYPTDRLYLAMVNAVAYKDGKWAEEREWRLFTLACNRAQDSVMYAKMKPTALYLGSKISSEYKRKLVGLACELNVGVYQEVITYDRDHKGMQFVEIDA